MQGVRRGITAECKRIEPPNGPIDLKALGGVPRWKRGPLGFVGVDPFALRCRESGPCCCKGKATVLILFVVVNATKTENSILSPFPHRHRTANIPARLSV